MWLQCAHAQMFEILNIETSKCFYWNLDQNCKIWLKISNPLWRYQQNVDCISTKWNISAKWNAHSPHPPPPKKVGTFPKKISMMESHFNKVREESFLSKIWHFFWTFLISSKLPFHRAHEIIFFWSLDLS